MPRFSIIVPAYRVQAYLHECLESVLSQSFADLELIAVDDRSPDGCGEIIDEFAAHDPRVTAVHLPANVGLGRARNAGLERATGDYLLFLDSDDTMTPGSLQAIAERLAATADPDVLIYDYARTFWYGRPTRNVLSGLLREDEPQVFRLEQRPELLDLLMVVWNKAYRREFVQRQGFTFPPGYYEDTPWTYPALITAQTISILDRVCVHYRQRRRGNILGSTSDKHLDIFEQYERVFAFLDERGLAQWRPQLFLRMVDHYTTIYNKPDRLPPSSRPEFFRRARAHHRRYGTSAAEPGGARTGLRHLLVRLGVRRTFQLLWGMDRMRRRLRSGLGKRYRQLRKACVQLHYGLQRRLPIDPDLAVFAAYWHKGYACNPAAIEAKARELLPDLRTAWVCHPQYAGTVPEGVTVLHPGSRAYFTALARAKYLVNNVNFAQHTIKRPGQIHLQTHHGTPLKTMGIDLQEYPAGAAGMGFRALLNRVDRWDYSLSSNRHSTLVWERAYPSDYTTLEYGYPRNDALIHATPEDTARLRESLGIPPGAIAVLYAPTHRDYRRGYLPQLDLPRLARELGPGYVFLVRPHYFYGGAGAAGSEQLIDVSGHPTVEELCLASDALLTDYSSIMFDYANLDRPILIHSGDWEAYRASRGTYFDITAEPPGALARTEDELIAAFSTGAWSDQLAAERRAAFRRRFCSYDDGQAAERVVRRVFLGQEPPALADGAASAGLPEQAFTARETVKG